MTKLALYEKKEMNKDERKIDYFLEDYVYINNFKTRMSITIIIAVIAFIGSLIKFSETLIFPMSLEELILEYLMVYIISWLILMVVYTFISTIVYSKKHYKSKNNYKKYMNIMKQLDEHEKSKEHMEGA